jgi:hypothetical protein
MVEDKIKEMKEMVKRRGEELIREMFRKREEVEKVVKDYVDWVQSISTEQEHIVDFLQTELKRWKNCLEIL